MIMTQARLPLLLIMLMVHLTQLLAAPIICGTDETEPSAKSVDESTSTMTTTTSTPKPSEVNQFLHNVQCSLEKAKPWIEDLEKEAKRLEETAKRVGLSIVHRFGSLMDSLIGAAANRIPGATTSTVKPSTSSSASTEHDIVSSISIEPELLTPSTSTESPLGSIAANEADNDINNVEPLK